MAASPSSLPPHDAQESEPPPPKVAPKASVPPLAAHEGAAPRAAESIVARLVECGLTTFFGIPGGPVIPIFDAILTNPRAELVESRHETYAAFEGMGYFRATGEAPVVVVTAGPGATNVVTGVVAAHLERVPMIILTGDVAWASTGQRLLQDVGPSGIGIEGMLSRVCRAVVRVSRAESAAAEVHRAISAALDPANPGPALVVASIDRAASRGFGPRVVAPATLRAHAPPSSPTLRKIEEELRAARRPLVIVGAGARDAADEVAGLVDAIGVPFCTTPQGKGIVSEAHPLSLRNAGMGACLWAREYMKAGPDVALVLGTDLDDVAMAGTPPVGPRGAVIHVDTDASVFGRNHATSLGVVCDVAAFSGALARAFRTGGPVAGGAQLARDARSIDAHDHPAFEADGAVPIAPHRVVADLARAAPPDTTFVTDIGEHMLFALHYLEARSKDAFVIHLGLGSMGSGIGSAIGLALGDRSRPVVCICGDGGMQMAGMELLVAIRHRLPILFAVFNDGRYNMVHHGYRLTFGRSAAFDAPMVDFVAWATSLGARAERIDGPGEISAGTFDGWADRGPVVLDVRQDANVRIRGDGRLEAVRQMSLLHVVDANGAAKPDPSQSGVHEIAADVRHGEKAS